VLACTYSSPEGPFICLLGDQTTCCVCLVRPLGPNNRSVFDNVTLQVNHLTLGEAISEWITQIRPKKKEQDFGDPSLHKNDRALL